MIGLLLQCSHKVALKAGKDPERCNMCGKIRENPRYVTITATVVSTATTVLKPQSSAQRSRAMRSFQRNRHRCGQSRTDAARTLSTLAKGFGLRFVDDDAAGAATKVRGADAKKKTTI